MVLNKPVPVNPVRLIRRYSAYILLGWTIIALSSFFLILYNHHRETLEEAAIEARTYYDLNMHYRRVVSGMGGVYVPVENLEPNPYLAIPERDVDTRDGKRLTLVNPAYLTRLVFEAIRKEAALPVINKITSLKALNPKNRPDAWEAGALKSFENGVSEAKEVSSIDGAPYLRLMRPFITEKSCLKCHGFQGYSEGDIRGGISIAVPLKPYYEMEWTAGKLIFIIHAALWAFVSGALIVLSRLAIRNANAFEETYELSLHDPLTGLANRRLLEVSIKESFEIAKRYGNDLSVVMADLDFFKRYNDTHGHAKGDALLKKAAEAISREIRSADLAVRYGGEEFLVLLHQTGLAEAWEVAERIRKRIESEGEVTISLGISAYKRNHTGSAEEIMEEADRALYAAKRNGRNRVEVYGGH